MQVSNCNAVESRKNKDFKKKNSETSQLILKPSITHLFKEAIHQCNCPESILEVISDSTGQELIPDKHCFVEDMACLIITKVLLKTTHNMVRIAKKEVLCKVHRA